MLSIVEVCRISKVSSRTVRVWEEEGLILSSRDKNGVRQFAQEILEEIKKIQILKEFGLSLKGIRSILQGESFCRHDDLLHSHRLDIEKQAQKLATLQRKLEQIEVLVDGKSSRGAFEFLKPTDDLVNLFSSDLFRTNSSLNSDCHRKYLEHETDGLHSDELIAWFTALKRTVRYAKDNGVPTRFVRGFAASSLVLRLLDWTTIDPCAEGLIPHNPFDQHLHFDIPFSETEHFFDFLRGVNAELESTKL